MIEAMKRALEALESCDWDYDYEENPYKTFDAELVDNATDALSQAIEQHDKQQAEFNAMVERVQKLERHACEIICGAERQKQNREHDLNDIRCECCGYMTYHREHIGCIKAAYQQAEKQEPVFGKRFDPKPPPVDDVVADYYKVRKDFDANRKQEPVAWSILDKRTGKHWYTNESKYTAQHYANEYKHQDVDGSSMVVKPLYTAPPRKEQDESYGYAKRLAESIWKDHYKEISPHWRPFPTTLGVLTQIDNMIAGLEKSRKEWQGLDDEDWANIPDFQKEGCELDAAIADWIEKRLKEKNT